MFLMPVELLCQWIVLRCECQLNTALYRHFFEQPGLIKEIAEAIQAVAKADQEMQALIDKIIELGERHANDGLSIGDSIDSWNAALMLDRKQDNDQTALQVVLDLMTHSTVGWRDDRRKAVCSWR